ncbi:MAG: hypothetical protein ILM98_12395 [Kiritimatiellae bacterium]|nr:hypothetical protein [Kiritimatiellia bacterium]
MNYCSLRSRRMERFWRSACGGGLRQPCRSAFGARLAQALPPPRVSRRVSCECQGGVSAGCGWMRGAGAVGKPARDESHPCGCPAHKNRSPRRPRSGQ